MEAARKQRSYRGFPDLRFVLTPVPPVALRQQQQWVTRATAWIAEHWERPSSVTVEDIFSQIPYNPYITTLTNLFADLPADVLEPYIPLADSISACVSRVER